jgi:hypothetical protein
MHDSGPTHNLTKENLVRLTKAQDSEAAVSTSESSPTSRFSVKGPADSYRAPEDYGVVLHSTDPLLSAIADFTTNILHRSRGAATPTAELITRPEHCFRFLNKTTLPGVSLIT